MPNIEGLGFNGHQNDDLRVKFGRIRDRLKGAAYFDEVVISFDETPVLNMKGEPEKEFLRVWATSQDEVDDIVRRLDPLDIDIEVAPLLAKWLPRRSVRNKEPYVDYDSMQR
jgi:hypothetical protein